jgi:hypothetical protein
MYRIIGCHPHYAIGIVAVAALGMIGVDLVQFATAQSADWTLNVNPDNIPGNVSFVLTDIYGPSGMHWSNTSPWSANGVSSFIISGIQVGGNYKVCVTGLGPKPDLEQRTSPMCASYTHSDISNADVTISMGSGGNGGQNQLPQNLYNQDLRNLMPGGIWNHYNP